MLNRAPELGAEETWTRNATAMLAQFQGDAATARKELDLVLESSPDNTLALALLSMVDYWDGDEIAWMDAVEELQKQDLGDLSYDEKLIVAYASALPYPKEAISALNELEADHRNYPVVRLLRAIARRYLAMFNDDLDESRDLLLSAMEDLKLVEGSLRDSPLAFQALITINLQARDVWRSLAITDVDKARELNDRAYRFEQAAIEHADEAARRFPQSFEAMWACAIAYQETGADERLARLIDQAELPHRHPIWNQFCALYWLRVGDQEQAMDKLEPMQDHPISSATRFVEHWIQLFDAQANDDAFREHLKQDVIRCAEDKIASGDAVYLFLDFSTLLMLGEREKARELASQASREIDDVSIQWFEPAYDSIKQLDFDIASLKNRWSSYESGEGPKLMIAYIHFYAACDAFGQGDRIAATESFKSCIDQGVFFIWIHWASRAFLTHMNDGWPEWIDDSE